MPLVYFFVLDVSYPAIVSGFTAAAIEGIKEFVDALRDHSRCKVGILTFDTAIQFYALRSDGGQPSVHVVSDIESPFVPLPVDLLVSLRDCSDCLDSLLDALPSMYSKSKVSNACFGAAIKCAYTIVRRLGGIIVGCLSSLPSVGIGKLSNREADATDPHVLLAPDVSDAGQFYQDFALDCSKHQVSVNLFLSSAQFSDIATLESMCHITGGQLRHYPSFQGTRDDELLRDDLVHMAERETGLEAVIRVRCSQGLSVSAHYGNFFIRSQNLLALPAVDADKAFAVQFQVEDLTNKKTASVQLALLYTTSRGERRIRVFTLCLPVTTQLSHLFKLSNADAIVNLTAKMALKKALESKLADAREALVNKLVDIFTVYRRAFASPQTPATQLVMPETLKLLPMHVLGLIKSAIFCAGSDVSADRRAALIALLRTAPIPQSRLFVYPRLFDVLDAAELQALNESENDDLPPALNLSSGKVSQQSVYLLDNGIVIYVYLGASVAPDVIEELFGSLETADGRPVSNVTQLDLSTLKLERRKTPLSETLYSIIDSLIEDNEIPQQIRITRDGDICGFEFHANLVEDRSATATSYYEFLVHLQKQVSSRLS